MLSQGNIEMQMMLASGKQRSKDMILGREVFTVGNYACRGPCAAGRETNAYQHYIKYRIGKKGCVRRGVLF